VRAGTGGDEACLFAWELFRMYERYAAAQGWRFEVWGGLPRSASLRARVGVWALAWSLTAGKVDDQVDCSSDEVLASFLMTDWHC
jgi:hypothetical protein